MAKILVIDDSRIRGTVGTRVKELLIDQANVNNAVFASYTPPICGYDNQGEPVGCIYGVDIPPLPSNDESYLARHPTEKRNRTIEEIKVWTVF